MIENEILGKEDWVGFAKLYLVQCNNESKSDDEIDKKIYSKLVELDTRLGTTAFDQFYHLLHHTNRLDIIEV